MEKKEINEENKKSKNKETVKRKISIITVFLWIFLVTTMITITSNKIKNLNTLESDNNSKIVQSAFLHANNLSNGDTIVGEINLNGGTIEDKGVLNFFLSGHFSGPKDAIKYTIVEVNNSNPNVATIVSPELNSSVDDKELAIKFKPGEISGNTTIEVWVKAIVPHEYTDTGLANCEICIIYYISNEVIEVEKNINPSDLSIVKQAEKKLYELYEDVSFNIKIINNSNRKISNLKVVDYCENCEEVIVIGPYNNDGVVNPENFSLDAGESIVFKAVIEEIQEENLVKGNKIINHAYLYVEDGSKIGESTAEAVVDVPIVYSAYRVKHEYYRRDKDESLILEDTVISNDINNIMVGTKVGILENGEDVDIELEKILEHTLDGKEYRYEYFGNSGNIVVESEIVKEITIKYIREEIEKEQEYVILKVEKIWEDNDNIAGKRPESVTLQIYGDDKLIEERVVSELDNWSFEIELPKHNELDEEIVYTVDEKETSKFYEKEISGYTVINKFVVPDEKTKVKIIKLWEDDNNKLGKRPESVILQVKFGNEVIAEKEVNESNNWSYEFEVPKYDELGKEFVYTVDEKETTSDYIKEIDGNVITNRIMYYDLPDTSDINILIYVIVFIVAIIGIIVVIILLKKNKK